MLTGKLLFVVRVDSLIPVREAGRTGRGRLKPEHFEGPLRPGPDTSCEIEIIGPEAGTLSR
jgi:hypothetical protein